MTQQTTFQVNAFWVLTQLPGSRQVGIFLALRLKLTPLTPYSKNFEFLFQNY